MEHLIRDKVKYIVVHHSSNSPPSVTRLDSPERIRLRHINLRGFDDIGYHYVIGGNGLFVRDGMLYGGRSELYQGAHALGYNGCSLGICLMGNLDIGMPTSRQLGTLYDLLLKKSLEYDIGVENILGHSELEGVTKVCPGRNVDMGRIRSVISKLKR